MLFLTIDPFVGIPVFIAKLSERQYCWRVLEDFHSQEYIQIFDVHNCLFMCVHFSIGGHDYRRTTRFRQGIHFSVIQVLLADHMHRRSRSPQQILRSSGLRIDAGRNLFSESEKNVALCSPLIITHFWPASTLASRAPLATLLPLEIDPQILESWAYADEVHLGK